MKASAKARKRRGVACSIRGCTNRIEVLGLCGKHVTAELDEWFRYQIYDRDSYTCQRCGAMRDIQCSHHVKREIRSVRWDMENAVCHCASCHVTLTHDGNLHVEWIRGFLGDPQYEALLDRAYGTINEYTGRREGGVKPDLEALLTQARGGDAEYDQT